MPVQKGTETVQGERKGYFKWGSTGKKYYYWLDSERSKTIAYNKALKQGRAIHARRGY